MSRRPDVPPMLSPRSKHRMFEAGFRAVRATGADRWLAPAAQGLGVILTFHRVDPSPPDAFAPNRLLSITPDFLDATLTELDARGFDVIGLDPIKDASLTRHRELFRDTDIVNIENLKNLELCGEGLFWFSCFPLKLENCDGSPIRAVAWFE